MSGNVVDIFGIQEDDDPTEEWLATISPTLADHWVAMWERMRQRGRAWRSQAAHCAVEFLTELLEALAPDEQLAGWQRASGKHANPDLYLQKGKGPPTRRLRRYYLGDLYGVPRATVDGLFMAVPSAIETLQTIKHRSSEDEQFESLIGMTRDVVAILVPNRPS